MAAMIDTGKVASNFEGAGFAKGPVRDAGLTIAEATTGSRKDPFTRDCLRGKLAAQQNDLVLRLRGSQVVLIVILAALANLIDTLG